MPEAAAATAQPALFEPPARPGWPFGKGLSLLHSGDQRAVFVGATPIHIWGADDRVTEAAPIATLRRARVVTNIGHPAIGHLRSRYASFRGAA